MGLSRLDNFLKSTRGTILYVDPSSLDATDSIENTGNSLTRPFKTIQRALIESARFSYQRGLNNDRFGKTTILLYPGDHVVDNRPGLIPFGSNQYYFRNGGVTNDLPPFDLLSNFDLESPDNELYKLNSIYGGVILPRGTSLVGLDLRKTKIRPKYVPNPENDNIERTALFRVTGACYLWQFSMFDGDPNGQVYVDYTSNLFVPNFSHHKLTCFEYADGVNSVNINDSFLTYSTDRTDLDMYYEKVGLVYGSSSGRQISPDYPSAGLDIQPKIDEYRIVGATGGNVLIDSISASGTDVTVTFEENVDDIGLEVDTPFRIQGVSETEYNGQFVVSERLSDTSIKYQVQNAPLNLSPSATGATLTLSSDTVTSASPYVFNVSLRSVFGMCGIHADGSKATGFKSMVIAQYTGIGLQKDDKAFVLYNQDLPSTGVYDDFTKAGNETLSSNSKAVYKPEYRNFHLKVSNNAFVQAVSIFAIGYAEHFVTESGGDISLTNSNSNFGANALSSSGFRPEAFSQDNTGYISHIYPPKEIPLTETSLEYSSIDVAETVTGVGTIYLFNQTNRDVLPETVIEGYRIGAKDGDTLNILIPQAGTVTEYSARIVMDGTTNTEGTEILESTAEKSFNVNRVAGINSIGATSDGGNNNVITLETAHNFINGETVRVISDTGQIPDGLEAGEVYNVITTSSGITTNTNIKLAKTLNDAINDEELTINNSGGLIKIISRVSDKNAGDIGHPIQYDTNRNNWYVNVATGAENTINPIIASLGTATLGDATPRAFIKRRIDNRQLNDTLYRVRYVIPSDAPATARPPVEGFIVQESSSTIGTNSEISAYFGSGSLSNKNDQRNLRFIANAEWSANVAEITTELPHNLSVGSIVTLKNVQSTANAEGLDDFGFNKTLTVTAVSSAKKFSATLTVDPGTFTNDTTVRNNTLPYFIRKEYSNIYYVYRISESQKYITGQQDGIYYLTLINSSNSPTVAPFTGENFSQPVKRMFPQIDRDNPASDPEASKCFADSRTIGLVQINDPKNSITRETVDKLIQDVSIGVGITDIRSTSGVAHTIYTNIDHGLNRVTKLSIVDAGSEYGTNSGSEEKYYNARLISIGSSITGQNATAKVTVSATGTVTDIIVMDGGSSYGIGNTMQVVGISTYGTTHQPAVVEVTSIYDNVGDVIRISGVSSESYSGYNDLYRITGVGIGTTTSVEKVINVSSASSVSGFSTAVGTSLTSDANLYLTGKSIKVSTFEYDSTSGIATVNTSGAHAFRVDNKIRITGASNEIYNGSFIVTEVVTTTRLKVNVGVGTESPTESSADIYALPEGFTSQDGAVTINNENTAGRMTIPYGGLVTTLGGSVPNASTTTFTINNLQTLDIRIGDYLQINNEIVRVKNTVDKTDVSITVFRNVLGTKATTHALGDVVTRVKPFATELHRHSIIRASGHTFEYVGFGPGNYSTAFPDKQDRSITADEELLAQSTKRSGGINFYTGMNDKGISYSGNKKLSTITGREEIFDTPVRTITGEDILEEPSINVTTPLEGIFTRSVKVEGGADSSAISEFNGPLVVNNKLTINSNKGVESNNLFLQGDATVSRNYTVGISTPILAGNPGNAIWKANPEEGGTWGYVYTTGNEWRSMSPISLETDSKVFSFDKLAVGLSDPGVETLKVQAGSIELNVDSDGVGIGATANGYDLRVAGQLKLDGTIVDGGGSSGSSGDVLTSTGVGVSFGSIALLSGWDRTTLNDGIYNTSLDFVGIGTAVPTVNCEIGAANAGGVSLKVNNNSEFLGTIDANNLTVTGFTTITGNYEIKNSSGQVLAGIVTTTDIVVGTAITTSSGNIGLGTGTPRAKVDIEGRLRTTATSEGVLECDIGVDDRVELDLSKSSVFTLTADANVNEFELLNIPNDAGTFTIKITQDATGNRTIGIDSFINNAIQSIPVYWPGGVVPVVTPSAGKTDIYSFKFFDGSNITTAGLYGVIGGQNFS